ncbi:MAG: hypothetical protein MUD14_10450 [Hydrococcus sp. Prado102]|nr:hypothetical protein [Hydrococcus sp. Prado102]
MTDANQSDRSQKIANHVIMANSGWKIVYNIRDRYFIEDIIAYVFINSGNSYELIPLTLPDLHLCQPLHEYVLKDGYVGLIDPQNEFIVNDYLEENQRDINIQKIKEALKKNRFKLE